VKCSHTNLGFILCQADQGTSAAGEYMADFRTCRETFSSMMSPVAMSLGDRFSVSRRGGAGEVDG